MCAEPLHSEAEVRRSLVDSLHSSVLLGGVKQVLCFTDLYKYLKEFISSCLRKGRERNSIIPFVCAFVFCFFIVFGLFYHHYHIFFLLFLQISQVVTLIRKNPFACNCKNISRLLFALKKKKLIAKSQKKNKK